MKDDLKTATGFLVIWILIGFVIGAIIYESWSDLDCNRPDVSEKQHEFCKRIATLSHYVPTIVFFIFTILGIYSFLKVMKKEQNHDIISQNGNDDRK